jgi:hypothetical protein
VQPTPLTWLPFGSESGHVVAIRLDPVESMTWLVTRISR